MKNPSLASFVERSQHSKSNFSCLFGGCFATRQKDDNYYVNWLPLPIVPRIELNWWLLYNKAKRNNYDVNRLPLAIVRRL